MKFYGNGILWNPKADKPLCIFENGEFETDEPEKVGLLVSAGYKYDGELEESFTSPENDETQPEEIFDYSEMSNEQLKQLLDSKGIEYKARATKSDLLELLQGTV